MNIIRTNSFRLQAMINGVTISAGIVMDSGTLAQQLNTVTNVATPSWSGGAGPQFHVEVRDTGTGDEMTVENYPKLYYNGNELSFPDTADPVNCVSSNSQLNGLLSRTLTPSSGTTPARWTYRFLKSPFDKAVNADSDTLRVEGVVMTEGLNPQTFRTGDQTVMVIPTTGQAQTFLACAEATDFDGTADGGKVHAWLVDLSSNSYDPVAVTSCKWYDLDGSAEKEITSADTNYAIDNPGNDKKNFYLKVKNGEVINGTEAFKAELKHSSGTYDAVAVMVDRTDGYFIGYTMVDSDNVNAGEVAKGGVAEVRIAVYSYSDPTTATVIAGLWPWVTLCKADGTVIDNPKIYYASSGPCQGTLYVGYQQLVDWGGMTNGYISLEDTAPTGYHTGKPTATTKGE